MFSGIIEQLGRVVKMRSHGSNITFCIEAEMAKDLKVDQSLAHNGVCLTVEKCDPSTYEVTAIDETLKRSNLKNLKKDSIVNLERCIKLGDRIDGHMVQGHVDTTGTCTKVLVEDGSWRFWFKYENEDFVTVPKGSICVNGVSLTVVDSADREFSVAVIPYTYEHTNFRELSQGDNVNLEFDILGKYIEKYMSRVK